MSDLESLLPERLRERPTSPLTLAYYLLAAEKPNGHLPCQPQSSCQECWDKGEDLRVLWAQFPVSAMANPAEKEARDLVRYWFGQGALSMGLVFQGMPVFDPALVP